MFRSIFAHHHQPSPPPSPPPVAAEPVDEGRLALHIPLLAGAMSRVGAFEDSLAARLHGDAGPQTPPAATHAVLEVPTTSGIRSFFGNPLAGIESAAQGMVHRLLREAEISCTHFVARWGMAALFCGVGLWAGTVHVRGDVSLFNLDGGRHPLVGWPLVVLALPIPVLPLVGAAIGEQAAHLACRDLEREAHPERDALPV